MVPACSDDSFSQKYGGRPKLKEVLEGGGDISIETLKNASLMSDLKQDGSLKAEVS